MVSLIVEENYQGTHVGTVTPQATSSPLQVRESGANSQIWLAKVENGGVDMKALMEESSNLDDAATQLMMGEGEDIQLLLGEALVLVDEDYMTEYCL